MSTKPIDTSKKRRVNRPITAAKAVKTPTKLVPLTDLRPAAYNPRQADEDRLRLVELSLRKFGFLLPVYSSAAGEIISGHQRHLCAERAGFEGVPVRLVKQDQTQRLMSLNLIFNRATNDMNRMDRTSELKAQLLSAQIVEQLEALPDVAVSKRYPCLHSEWIETARLRDANMGRWESYPHVMARSVRANFGIQMPCVVERGTLRVVNGIGRLQESCEQSDPKIEVVWVDKGMGELAGKVLNLLSMDFTLHIKYADILRHNSFRRVNTGHHPFAIGYLFGIEPQNNRSWDYKKPENIAKWKAFYGMSVADFGSGRGDSTATMRGMGVRVSEFEPYRIPNGSNQIDREVSTRIAKAFLVDVADGVQWSSIFLSDIFNSVPFLSDRLHIVQIVAAMSSPKTRVYAQSFNIERMRELEGDQLGDHAMNLSKFPLDYEPGITIGELSGKPKVQKYHTQREFWELLKTGFNTVDVTTYSGSRGTKAKVSAVAASPLKIDPKKLAAALRFEFELPYPDGERMGLGDLAVSSFNARLGLRMR